MATGLLETGPKLDWTRDNKIFDCYQIWKEKVELIFSSALEESSSKQKVSYLRYWMGEQGIPLVKKWTALGKLDFSSSEEDALSSGYILQNYWNLLEAEFKPKGNKLLSVIELWTRSKQGSKTLNEWLTYVYNLVESCDYGDSSERIIRDVLIIGCNSDKAKDKIVRQGEKIKLQDVIREKCREPNSYMVEIPATGQCFRRNSNFIKPRQTDKNSVSTDPLPTTGLPEIPQEPPVLQQPSSQATSTVDAIPTVPPSKQNGNSTPRTPSQPRASRRSTKGIPPPRLGLQE